ncbi:hypothetical protein ACFMBG_23795 [Leisingera sp. D0M16]|uniref:hypothetical protein n=1 Tax=Leisingera coralii TaxID=3351347 RepID=UPI003B79CD26
MVKLKEVPFEERLEAELRLRERGVPRPKLSSFVLCGIAISGFSVAVLSGLSGGAALSENALLFLPMIAVGGLIGRSIGREMVAAYERALEITIGDLRREKGSSR